MKKNQRQMHVLMNGILIGTIEKQPNGSIQFSYDPNWLATPGARPISLSLPLIDEPFVGDRIYNYLDNLLPDNPQIRARIQAKFRIASNHPFDLLASIGKDCVGAIQITDQVSADVHKIAAQKCNEKSIANILRGYQDNPLGMNDEFQDFRISIAGAQEKAAFLQYKKAWNIPLRETPTTHIFKLPIGFIPHQNMDLSDSCENEWLCAEIARAFGLTVPHSEILHFEEVKVLVVERFDRRLSANKKWILRLPQEDLCQALGVSSQLKYQADGGPGIKEIMQLLMGSVEPSNDRDNFYRAQVLFWLLAAIDGHAKNFSIFLEAGGKYRLAPLYDIMSAYPLIAKRQLQLQKIKMAMALQGTNNHYHCYNIQRRHFIDTAKNANYSTESAAKILDEMLAKVETVINLVSAILPANFPEKIAQSVFDGMRWMKVKLQS